MTTFALLAGMLAASAISAYAHTGYQGPVIDNNAPKASQDAKTFFEQIQRDSN